MKYPKVSEDVDIEFEAADILDELTDEYFADVDTWHLAESVKKQAIKKRLITRDQYNMLVDRYENILRKRVRMKERDQKLEGLC